MKLYFYICLIGLVRIVMNSNARKTSSSDQDISKERTRPARYRALLAKHGKYFLSEDELFSMKNLKYSTHEEPKFFIIENNVNLGKPRKWNNTDINDFSRTFKLKTNLRSKRSIGKSNQRQSRAIERNLQKRSRKLNDKKASRHRNSGKRSSEDAGKDSYVNMAFPSVDKELINNYLKSGYAVRIYNTVTYDVIFRKSLPRLLRDLQRGAVRRKRSRQNSGGKRNRLDVSVRHRRHLSDPSEIVGTGSRSARIAKIPRHREKMRKCASNPCQNGGTCLRDKALETEICLCAEGYYGFYCEGPSDRCSSLPCLNGGTCVSHDVRFECFCPAGFIGEKCETDVDECASRPCFHGGECHDLVNGYRCRCSQKYEGENCEYLREHNWLTICQSNACLNGGICLKVTDETRCVCPKLYSGNRCEIPVPDATILCEKMLCLNGGICQPLNRAGPKCLCPKLYIGKHCELHSSPCISSPCPDNKTCLEDRASFDRSFTCISGSGISIAHIKVEVETQNNNVRKFGALRIAGITILLLIMLVAIFCIVCTFQEDQPRLQERKQLVSYSIPESNNTSNNLSTFSQWKKAKEAVKKRSSNF